jgi:hypothetical protein
MLKVSLWRDVMVLLHVRLPEILSNMSRFSPAERNQQLLRVRVGDPGANVIGA